MTDPPKGPRALDVEALKGEKRKKPIMISCWNLEEIKRAVRIFGYRGLHITMRSDSIKGANLAASRICLSTSSGTGSGLYLLIILLLTTSINSILLHLWKAFN